MTSKARPNLIQRTLAISGLAIALIVGMAIYQIWYAYKATVESSERGIQQLAQILDASASSTFQSVEVLIDRAADEIIQQDAIFGSRDGLSDRFLEIGGPWDFVHSVVYVDTDGVAQGLVVREVNGVLRPFTLDENFKKLESFQYHATGNSMRGDAVYISDPIFSRVTPDSFIPLSKALRGPNGEFLGLSMVTVSLDTFTELYAGLLPTSYRSVTLYKRNGNRVFRLPAPPGEMSAKFGDQPLFAKWLAESPAGVFRSVDEVDGREYLVAYRESSQYPIVITASVAWDEVLAFWKRDSYFFAGLAFVGIVIVLTLTLLLVRRIRAEQLTQNKLRASQRNLAESQQLGGICYFERHLATNTVIWSADMYAAHGVDPSTFTPTRASCLKLIVPQDRPKVMRTWAPPGEDPVPSGHVVYRIAWPSGEVRHIRYAWRLFEGDDHSPERIFGVAQDVTALRRAEDTIRDDEVRLQDILECSSEYIWETDVDGLLTFLSGEGAHQFGDVIGKRRSVFNFKNSSLSGGDIEKLHEALIRKKKFRNLIIPAKGVSGETHWIRVSGNPRFDQDGSFVGFRGAGNDVTEVLRERETEEHRRKVEALGRLAGGLAHEINNLIQPILIYATVGETTSGISDDIRKYFRRISRASEHATLIVKNVLTYARQGQPKKEHIDVPGIISEIADLVEGMLPANVSLVIDQNLANVPVLADRTGLTQALTNLLTNASESMPEGGQIKLRAMEEDISGDTAKDIGLQPGRYCRLEIKDEGLGMSEDRVAKIFDPFFTTKSHGQGTGLGLSVVSGLVKSWGGVVTVDSKEGAGSRFSIYIPVLELQQHAAQ